jgi:hypothetical protein
MPTTLEQWYKWAFKLDWQYHQEQADKKDIDCLLSNAVDDVFFGSNASVTHQYVCVCPPTHWPRVTQIVPPNFSCIAWL